MLHFFNKLLIYEESQFKKLKFDIGFYLSAVW